MSGLIDPAEGWFAIVPSDTEEFERHTRSVYVGFGGNLYAIGTDGSSDPHYNVQDGTVLPLQAKQMLLTGTTASGMLGYY